MISYFFDHIILISLVISYMIWSNVYDIINDIIFCYMISYMILYPISCNDMHDIIYLYAIREATGCISPTVGATSAIVL